MEKLIKHTNGQWSIVEENLQKGTGQYTAKFANKKDNKVAYHVHNANGEHVATVNGWHDKETGLYDPDIDTSGPNKIPRSHWGAAIKAATAASRKHEDNQ
jgi:hypothetical protein